MKKVVLASVLAVATGTLCSMPAALAQDQGSQPNQITIKDPAEYNAYSNAIGQSSPAAKSSAIEAFLTQYPQTVVKAEVLQELMGAYQAQNNTDKMLDAATRLLQVDPTNLRALTFYVYLKEAQAKQKAADTAAAQPLLDDAAAKAQQGLGATKPAALPQADFDKLKAATTPIFHSAIATDALAKKDYATAIKEFQEELKSYPDPAATTTGPALNDTYLLGTAYVQQEPKDLPNGIFYLTRAAQYAPGAAKDTIEQAAEYWYKKYHRDTTKPGDGLDGFDQVKQLAHDNLFPPDTYKPVPAPPPPSPDKLAHDAVVATPDLKSMALADKEFVLANGNDEDAGKVWDVMKGVRTQVPGIVVSATPDSVQLAVSQDAQQSKTADFTINFTKPLAELPAVGANVKYDATFDSYTKTPPMIILKEGEPVAEKKAPVHHPAAHRPAAHH
jgi:tetratricopeptide (TPR) repeat protein